MTGTGVPADAVPVREAGALARLRARLACRHCVVGWAVYLALAVAAVALFGGL